MDGISDFLNAPGNVLSATCNGISDAGSAIGGFFEDLFGRRRRKRCDIPPVIPDFDPDVEGIDFSALEEWIKSLKPDIDIIDLNLDDFKNLLKSNSISSIRQKIVDLLKVVFKNLETYTEMAKKGFYALSLILVIFDAFR